MIVDGFFLILFNLRLSEKVPRTDILVIQLFDSFILNTSWVSCSNNYDLRVSNRETRKGFRNSTPLSFRYFYNNKTL